MTTVGSRRVIVVFEVLVLVAVLVTGACMAIEEEDSEQQLLGKHDVGNAQETAKGSSESWTGWAKDKISEGLGFKGSESDPVPEPTVKDAAAGKITDAATGAHAGAAGYASDIKEGAAERAGKAKDKACEAAEEAKEKTKEAYERTKEKAEESATEAKDKAAEEVKEKQKQAEEQVGWAKEKAKQGYEAAKGRAEETYEAARDTVASTLEADNDEKPVTHGSRTSDEEL